jgi:hypothetical protein
MQVKKKHKIYSKATRNRCNQYLQYARKTVSDRYLHVMRQITEDWTALSKSNRIIIQTIIENIDEP